MASHSSGLITISCVLLMAFASFCGPVGKTCGQDLQQEYPLAMYANPQLEGPTRIRVIPEGLEPLWLKALQRPAPSFSGS